MTTQLLINGADTAPDRATPPATVLLAHGAGGPMDTPWMTTLAEGLAGRGMRVARFEFAYMAARRGGASKRPPPKAALLCPEYLSVIEALKCSGPLIIAGKSMGGRIASLIAQDLFTRQQIAGLVCLGFPFHAPGKAMSTRAAHLAHLTCPTLVCQGTRDRFGTRGDVEGQPLSRHVRMHWVEDGDHDLKPRKRVTGRSQDDTLSEVCETIAAWAQDVLVPTR
ncbi:alpha/beta hydrolase [Pseudooceanicola sediminis]|uniref:Alpha/beta hydrolase n=1 Tax=Pseudooceanicola sediminis TaxID=2211117 RepID=A0A399IWQ3_9RHOB|nr:alpha/beta family hydrolase [Pseudooceanicola sediminis]KAA2312401.1 alpha/beta hydrolase [Puniceibacterium sp. HSS470]RII37451.1 alpha/beta hydrolase [Pseudooceanicola sediminis]|tara:strand:+ start:17071 stop:17739 length:669 start_codon:yes stop_codon:yes gene_type:complete